MSHTIAIVEDDTDQRENYVDAMRAQGYQVRAYADYDTALAGFQEALPDLVILDVMLEQRMDGGFDLCRMLRQQSPHLPIIFLTARSSDIDRVSGLRLDAWDYLSKPVDLEFLAVRVASLFRIAETLQSGQTQGAVLVSGALELDQSSMSVRWRGKPMNLTLTEFWLVDALAREPGHVRSYRELIAVTRQSYVEKNTINSYIRRLRKKFKEVDAEFDMIQTIFGVGYRWQPVAGEAP